MWRAPKSMLYIKKLKVNLKKSISYDSHMITIHICSLRWCCRFFSLFYFFLLTCCSFVFQLLLASSRIKPLPPQISVMMPMSTVWLATVNVPEIFDKIATKINATRKSFSISCHIWIVVVYWIYKISFTLTICN